MTDPNVAKKIEERLEAGPRPEPPPDLLQKIQDEIPEYLPSAGGEREGERASRWSAGRLRLLAASLFVVVAGGLVAYRVGERAPSPEAWAQTGEGPLASAPETAGRPPAATDSGGESAADGGADADGYAADPGAAVERHRQDLAERLRELADAARERQAREPAADTRSDAEPRQAPPADRASVGGNESGRRRAEKPASAADYEAEVASLEQSPATGPAEGDRERTAAAEEIFGAVDEASRAAVPEAAAAPPPSSSPAGVQEPNRPTARREMSPPVRKRMQEMEGRLGQLRSQSARGEAAEPQPAPGEIVFDVPEPARPAAAPPSTGGTTEPNDQAFGSMFFRSAGVNPFIDTEDDIYSTFGLDVDTGSYTLARSYIQRGHLPPAEAVRVEEFVNYFDYGPGEGRVAFDEDPRPTRKGYAARDNTGFRLGGNATRQPDPAHLPPPDFAVTVEGAPSPFGEGARYHLVRFHLRAREVEEVDRRPAVLTFVVDVSGSMRREGRLALVQQALYLLLGQLDPRDRVGLVVYGNEGEVVQEPTSDHRAIRRAIDRLEAGGSTNAEEGLVLGYEVASRHFRRGAVNRVILCSDGVANVGRTGPESILERIGSEARRGIELTTVGVGMGNYNDVLMERLADRGNGAYAYVDSLEEARRVFVENLTGTLQTVASDAKVQVVFHPEVVSRYRLIGYENRAVADEDFRNDAVDAGEIGAGHQVTALYEVKLQEKAERRAPLATLHLRYRSTATGAVVETAHDLSSNQLSGRWERSSRALRLASLVAEFAEILRHSYWAREGDLEEVFRRAQAVSALYPGDADVAEFASLVGKATQLAVDRGEGRER